MAFEAEELYAAAQGLGLPWTLEFCQAKVREAKESGKSVDEWMRDNLRTALEEEET